MSTEICFVKHGGSVETGFYVTKFYGGSKNGNCLQLTGLEGGAGVGYVKLNKRSMKFLIDVWQKEVGKIKIGKPVRRKPASKKSICETCCTVGCRGADIPFIGKAIVMECRGYTKKIAECKFQKHTHGGVVAGEVITSA